MAEQERKIFVVGHKNPDTDSICSAIAYANLKKILTGKSYVPGISVRKLPEFPPGAVRKHAVLVPLI